MQFNDLLYDSIHRKLVSVKDLGVLFDSKRSYSDHIRRITKVALKVLDFEIFNSYVRSQLEYA